MSVIRTPKYQPSAGLFALTCLLMAFSQGNGVLVVTATSQEVDPYWGVGLMLGSANNTLLRLLSLTQDAEKTKSNVYYGNLSLEGSNTDVIQDIEMTYIEIEADSLAQKFTWINQNHSLNSTAKTLLEAAIVELEEHSTLLLNRTTSTNLTLIREIHGQLVWTLWDPDDSIRKTLASWWQSKDIKRQPFNGDEVLIVIQIGYYQELVGGTITSIVSWTFENEENATATRDFVDYALRDQRVRQLLCFRDVPVPKILFFLGPPVINVTGSATRFRPTIDILQIRLENVVMSRVNDQIITSKFDTTILESHLVGMFVWNDTNANGQVDQWLTSNIPGMQTVGQHSEFNNRFDFLDFGSVVINPPNLLDDSISFGISFSSITGRFIPVEERADVALFARPINALDKHLTIFNVNFQLNSDTNTGEAALKMDLALSEWNDTGSLEGLGLSLLYISSFTTFHSTIAIQVGSHEFNPDSIRSGELSRIRFHGKDDWGYVDLDSDRYQWNEAESLNVLGTVIPLGYGQVAMSRSEQGGRLVREVQQSMVARSTVLYGITYPKWDGKSILHDPTFSVYTGKVLIAPSEEIISILQPGSIALFAIATVGLATIGLRQRFKV